MAHLAKKTYIEGINIADNLSVDFDIENNGLEKVRETIDNKKNHDSKKKNNNVKNTGTDDSKKNQLIGRIRQNL